MERKALEAYTGSCKAKGKHIMLWTVKVCKYQISIIIWEHEHCWQLNCKRVPAGVLIHLWWMIWSCLAAMSHRARSCTNMADLACGGWAGPGGREGGEHSVPHASRQCRWCRGSRNHLNPAWGEPLLLWLTDSCYLSALGVCAWICPWKMLC